MASYLLIGTVEHEGEKHLSLLANCTKREEYLAALKEVQTRPEVQEILCLQGNVLPVKVADNKITAIEISRIEYPLTDTVVEYTSNPVYIGGNNG